MSTRMAAYAVTGRAIVARISCGWLLCIALVGCSNLTVKMDVLNPAAVERKSEEALIASGMLKLSGASDAALQQWVDDLQAVHRQGYVRLRDLYISEAEKKSDGAKAAQTKIANDLLPAFDRNVKGYYLTLLGDLKRYRADLRTLLNGRYGVGPGDAGYREIVDILKAWDYRLRQVSTYVRADIGEKGSTASAAAVTETANEAAAQIQRDLAQISLQNSPYAYAVANAPESDWTPRYNKVYTTGQFGASDVAIKLDPNTGNYLLKGLSFDPSDVAAIASKVTTQAVLLTAQIAGVPVKTSSVPVDGSAGKALAASSGALVDAQASVEARRAQDASRRSALIALAHAILSEEAELDASDDRRRAAMEAIRLAYDTRRPQLLPPTPAP